MWVSAACRAELLATRVDQLRLLLQGLCSECIAQWHKSVSAIAYDIVPAFALLLHLFLHLLLHLLSRLLVAPIAQWLRIRSRMQEVRGSSPTLGGLRVSQLQASGGISTLQSRASGLQSTTQGNSVRTKRVLRVKQKYTYQLLCRTDGKGSERDYGPL